VRLTIIGCAGSFPAPGSAASCYLVEAEDDAGRTWRITLDFGNGAMGPLQSHLALSDLDAVVLSHLHSDHCLDLTGLYVAYRYHPAGPPAQRLPVYGPVGTMDRLEGAYGEHESGSLALAYDVRELGERVPVQIGPFTITPVRVVHPILAYGLRVEAGGAVLAYSGDTEWTDALIEAGRDADPFIIECYAYDRPVRNHLNYKVIEENLARIPAKRIMLTHMGEDMLMRRTDVPHLCARDGMVVTL